MTNPRGTSGYGDRRRGIQAHAHGLHARGGTPGAWRKRTSLLWRNRTFLSGYYIRGPRSRSYVQSRGNRGPGAPIRRPSGAAGKIHSDIERGFIRAEVVPWQELVERGNEAKCKEAGVLRVEGKDYVIQDGDIVHFRFNV